AIEEVAKITHSIKEDQTKVRSRNRKKQKLPPKTKSYPPNLSSMRRFEREVINDELIAEINDGELVEINDVLRETKREMFVT
ncbi:hypothetical protein L195_g036233, partial [Trifolium pratense]